MDRLNWSKLKTFYRVASCGSFARAAEKYHISSTALSKMVKTLEQELNCQLFTRNDNGVELTHKGELLYRDAIRMTNMLEFTEKKILGDSKQIKNHLKLVVSAGTSTMYISRFIDAFVNNYPDIYLEVVSYDDMSLNEKLTGHILIHPFIKDLNGYKQEFLINMELKLFASQDYLEKHGVPLTVGDLNNHRLIGFSHEKKIFTELNWHLKIGMPKGHVRTPVFEADANFGRCYLAYKGVGIITVPKQHPDIKKYELVEVLPHISGGEYGYHLIVDEVLYENETVKILAEFLKKKFSEL
jgi:DNA-binding transcriptional LysR family regulator